MDVESEWNENPRCRVVHCDLVVGLANFAGRRERRNRASAQEDDGAIVGSESRAWRWRVEITRDLTAGLVFGSLVALVEVYAAFVTTGRFDLPAAIATGVWDALLFGVASLLISPVRYGLERAVARRVSILALLLGLTLTLRLTADAIFSVLPNTVRALVIALVACTLGGVALAAIGDVVGRKREFHWSGVFVGLLVLLYTSVYWRQAVHADGTTDLVVLIVVCVVVTSLAIWIAARSPRWVLRSGVFALLVLTIAGRVAVGPAPFSRILSADSSVDPVSASEPSAIHPNLILIVLDTVRADHLDLYGYSRETMPNLTRLSRRATVFDDCTSSTSWTLPSHASLFTGLPSRVHGVHRGGPESETNELQRLIPQVVPLADEHTTLAEALRDRGYQTAGIGANFLYLNPKNQLNQGFEYWDATPSYRGALSEGYFPLHLRTRSLLDATPLRWLNEPFVSLDIAQTPYERATSITDRAIQRIDAFGESPSPFFLFLNYMDAHDIYQAPGEYADFFPGRDSSLPRHRHGLSRMDLPEERIRSHLIAQYDSELAYLDSELGRLFDDLEERGLLEDTMIIITSDHGEAFLEHETWTHGNSLYQNEVRVPMIVYDPHVGEGRVVEQPVSINAVMPWFLERIGVDGAEGVQAIPDLSAFGPVVAELHGQKGAPDTTIIRENGLKLTVFSDGAIMLFDLAADPDERVPVDVEGSADVERLLSDLDRWKEQNPMSVREARSLSEADREQLRVLGYAE